MKWLVRAVLIVLVLSFGISAAARLEPDLAARLAACNNPNQKFAVSFTMKDQTEALALDPNIPNLPKPQRRARVAQVLREHAAATQRDLLAQLRTEADAGRVDGLNSIWLVNEVACFATKDVIMQMVDRSDVSDIMYDLLPINIGIPKVVPKPPTFGHEANLDVTKAPGAWAQGYTGHGVTVGEVDTGIWYTHQDLINHLWTSAAYPHPGFNYGSHILFPSASNPSPNDTLDDIDYAIGHGTHCAGIATGDGSYGNGTHDTVGVAPGAKIMVCNALVYFNGDNAGETLLEQSVLLGFQFCISPPRDPTNGADVVTTSLGIPDSYHPRYANYRFMERNMMEAGIPHACAAGNEGPTAQTIRCMGDVPPPWPNPANNPTDTATAAVITVGATDNSDNAASFTSIGPSVIWGNTPPYNDYVYPPGLMDPDVCAPGVNIFSTFWQGDQAYTTMSGTSMATPATAGCIALMLSKNPNLTPRQVDSILEMTSHDLGPTGKDVTYGQGRINCSLAVALEPLPSGLQLLSRIIDDAAGNGDGIVNPGEAINVPTTIYNADNFAHNTVTGKIVKNGADPLFTITDSMKTFGDVPALDSASTGSNGFKFTVDPSATDGHVLATNLILKDASESTWVIGFNFTVGTAALSVDGIVVKDTYAGNSNGRLDPGETADLIISVHNGGGGNGYNVAGHLASSNPTWLSVGDPDGIYGTILHGHSASNTADHYAVTVDPSVPGGTVIPCTLHLSGTDYSTTVVFTVTIGIPAEPPGTIIWGPKTAPGMPANWGLYGMGYDRVHDVLYATYHGNGLVYKYTGDSMLLALGTLPTPHSDTGCHDIKYDVADNALWIHDGQHMKVYKMDTLGNLLDSFPTHANDYPTGLAWDEASRKLYEVDRRNTAPQGYIYACDDLGNLLYTITHPLNIYTFGPRCLALDNTNTNPYGKSLINLYTWCGSGAPDSAYVYEMDTATGAIYNSLHTPDPTWNERGVEYDPRDGSLWIGIMQNLNPPPSDNSIVKVYGFHIPQVSAVAENNRSELLRDHVWVQAHPNPFKGGTVVAYNLPSPMRVALRIYDAAGREVRTLYSGAGTMGEHMLNWNGLDNHGRTVTPGIYFARCQTENSTANSKLIFLK